jgi:hypothetical protein
MDRQQLTIRNIVRLERMIGRGTYTKRLRMLRMLLAGEQDTLLAFHRAELTHGD